MKRIIVCIGVLLSVLAHGKSQEKINIAISAAPNNLNPFFSTDANSQNINRLVHKSLIDFNQKMQFECKACRTYSESMVGSKQVLKFSLREDLFFSDGTPVLADDVKKSWEYFAKNSQIKSTFMGAFEAIETVNVIDKYNLEIIFSGFSLENLSNLALLKIVKLKNANYDTLEAMDIVGCGDYVLSEVQPLEITVIPRDKNKLSFIFKVVKDETTLALKLINREIDLAVANISPRKINWLKAQSSILKIWDLPSGNFLFMGLNHKKEMFKDIRLRKAISLLIPRQDILKYKLKDTAVLSVGMFSPAFAEMYESKAIEAHDVQAARKLLSEAGYKKNSKGILEKEGKELVIDWKVSNNKASIEVVEVIEHYLEKEGFKINVGIQEWGTFMSAFKGGKFDVVVGQWVGFTGPDMLKFVFHSTSTPPKGGNRTSYKNAKVDELIDQATIETNAEKRTKTYKEALEIINQDYAYINLWHPNIVWVANRCLKNIELEPTGSFYSLLKLEKNHEGSCGK
ncbi:MAG: ABC transporter substrate-binding protein [Bacteriovorax sp.]|nr:ABC transporter substrate-binding protein [Bacteriovorax sp.]